MRASRIASYASPRTLVERGLVLALVILFSIGCATPAAPPTAPPQPAPTAMASPSAVATPAPTSPMLTATPASAATASLVAAPNLTPSPTVPAAAQPAVAAAIGDLSGRLGVPESAISVVNVTSATWPNSALGCPKPGIVYSQIVTPGYRIILAVGSQSYEYHSGRGSNVVSCTLP